MNKSESIGKLALALSKLQGEIKNVVANKKGYGYMYSDLAQVLDVSRPLLAKNELAITQLCNTDEKGATVVETVLIHSSGEWISTSITVPVSISKGLSAAQGVGICITYGRRYAMCALLGVAQEDEDTDAALPEEKKEAKTTTTVEAPPANVQDQMTKKLKGALGEGTQPYVDAMTPTQRLLQLVKEKGLQEKEAGWLTHFKVESLEQLSSVDAVRLIKTIEGKV